MSEKRSIMSSTEVSSARIWDVVTKLAVAVSIITAGAIINHEVRLGRIEESRFTSSHGAALEQRLRSDTLSKSDFRDDMVDIKASMRTLESLLRGVESRLARLEGPK